MTTPALVPLTLSIVFVACAVQAARAGNDRRTLQWLGLAVMALVGLAYNRPNAYDMAAGATLAFIIIVALIWAIARIQDCDGEMNVHRAEEHVRELEYELAHPEIAEWQLDLTEEVKRNDVR